MSRQKLFSSSFQYKQQDPDYMGQKLDQQYKSGPLPDRKCTDVFCCLLLLILIGGMCYVGVIGFQSGDPRYLASPFDEDGMQCKYQKGYQQYQKIYISYLRDNPQDISFVCVKQCPSTDQSQLQCKTTSFVPECSNLKIYNSKTIVNLCYPNQQSILQQFNFDKYMDVTTLQEYFSDLQNGWPLILGSFVVAFIVSILFTVLIRYCAGGFVWTVIFVFMTILLAVGTVSFLINDVQFLKDIFHYDQFPDNLKDVEYQRACAIICWVIFAITFLIICCMRKQITRSIQILKAAADFTREQCSSIFIPVYITIIQVLFLAVWTISLLFIYSSNETDVVPVDKTPFAFVEWNDNIQRYTILYVFGLLWILFFFEGLGCYWSSSTVAIWYFEEGDPDHPILRSIARSIKQVGGIAFGSLLIAIVVFIRLMLQFITSQLKQRSLGMDQQAAPAKFALKCASCYIACFQRIIRFLTTNAYIMMAISGKNFCTSAKQSFYLMLRSASQYAISHGTTKMFVNISKLLIILICCVIGYIGITQIEEFRAKIYSPVFLTIFFGIVSYPVAAAFMSLFEMAANTILMCYCIELDLIKGNNPKCPPALRNFLRKYADDSDIQS